MFLEPTTSNFKRGGFKLVITADTKCKMTHQQGSDNVNSMFQQHRTTNFFVFVVSSSNNKIQMIDGGVVGGSITKE